MPTRAMVETACTAPAFLFSHSRPASILHLSLLIIRIPSSLVALKYAFLFLVVRRQGRVGVSIKIGCRQDRFRTPTGHVGYASVRRALLGTMTPKRRCRVALPDGQEQIILEALDNH